MSRVIFVQKLVFNVLIKNGKINIIGQAVKGLDKETMSFSKINHTLIFNKIG